MSYTETELEARFARLGSGWHDAALDELTEIIAHAEAGGHQRLAFRARRDLADRHCVAGQWDKGFPLFARCLAEFDSRPEDFGPHEEWSLRSWYVRTVTTMAEYPEISLDQVAGLLADMRGRFAARGHSLAGVHSAERWLAFVRGDWAAEEVAYRQWHLAGGPRPNYMWDYETEIERLVHRGDPASVDRALALAEPVLDGRMTFAESIAPIEAHMLPHWAKLLQPERLAQVFQRMDRGFDEGGPWRYEYPSMVIEFLALTGNEEEAFQRYRRRMCHFTMLTRPYGRLEFATSSAIALGRLVMLGRGPELVPCLGCDGKHPTKTMSERHAELHAEAKELAAKFDARNGTTWHTTRVARRLAASPLLEFLPLQPGARPRSHRTPPLGCPPDAAVHAARWLLDRGMFVEADEYIALAADSPDPAVRAGALEGRARRADDHTTVPLLRDAAAAHAAAGNAVRGDLCLVTASRKLLSDRDFAAAEAELAGPLERLRADADPQSVGRAEVLRAELLSTFDRVDEAMDLIAAVIARAQAVGDDRSLGEAYFLSGRIRAERKDAADLVAADFVAAICALAADRADFRARQPMNRLVNFCVQAGDRAGLIEHLTRCERELPAHTGRMVVAELRLQRGMALHRLGRNEEAFAELSFAANEYAALDFYGGSQRSHWVSLAEVCAAVGRWDQAYEHSAYACSWADSFRKQYKIDDADIMVTGRYILADSLRELGRLDAAVTEYRKLIDEALAENKRDFARYGHDRAGDLLLRMHRPAGAAADFAAAAELAAELGKAQGERAKLLVKEVIARVRAGEVNAAEAALARAREQAPTAAGDMARIDVATAHVLFARGEIAAARTHTERAIEPLHAAQCHDSAGLASLFLAQQHLAAARRGEAIVVLRAAIPRIPSTLPIAGELAALLTSLGSPSFAASL